MTSVCVLNCFPRVVYDFALLILLHKPMLNSNKYVFIKWIFNFWSYLIYFLRTIWLQFIVLIFRKKLFHIDKMGPPLKGVNMSPRICSFCRSLQLYWRPQFGITNNLRFIVKKCEKIVIFRRWGHFWTSYRVNKGLLCSVKLFNLSRATLLTTSRPNRVWFSSYSDKMRNGDPYTSKGA